MPAEEAMASRGRYRVLTQRTANDDGWSLLSEHASPCAASAAADAQPIHAQAWDMGAGEPKLVRDNGKWPGEPT